MANLIKKIDEIDKIDISFFEKDYEKKIKEVVVIEEENLIIVKGIGEKGKYYSFFDIQTQKKISIEKRIEKYHQKVKIENISKSLSSETTYFIDKDTGYETTKEKLIQDGKIIYTLERERYKKNSKSLYSRYIESTAFDEQQKKIEENFLKKFNESDFYNKCVQFRTFFKQIWKANCELGFENPEFFLTHKQYDKMKNLDQFYDVLKEVFKTEEIYTNIPGDILYKDFISFYEKKNAC